MAATSPLLEQAGAFALDRWRRYQLEGILVMAAGLGLLLAGWFVQGVLFIFGVGSGLGAIAIGGWGYVYHTWRLRRFARFPLPVAYAPPPPPPDD